MPYPIFYSPSPEEIAEATARIRASWTPEEHERRRNTYLAWARGGYLAPRRGVPDEPFTIGEVVRLVGIWQSCRNPTN